MGLVARFKNNMRRMENAENMEHVAGKLRELSKEAEDEAHYLVLNPDIKRARTKLAQIAGSLDAYAFLLDMKDE